MGYFVFNTAVVGSSVNRDSGVFGECKRDSSIAVLDGYISKGGRVGDVHGSICIGNINRSLDALDRDVAGAGVEFGGSDDLGAGQLFFGRDVDHAVQLSKRKLRSIGMEGDGACERLHVGVSVKVAFQGDVPGDVREVKIVGMALDLDIPLDGVS